MDVDIEVEIATDWQISGTVLSIKKKSDCFSFIFENATQVVKLGKTELLNMGTSSGVRNVFALQNKIHEFGKFENGKMFENKFKLIKNNVLEIESIEYFNEKKLIIKTVYLKEGNN